MQPIFRISILIPLMLLLMIAEVNSATNKHCDPKVFDENMMKIVGYPIDPRNEYPKSVDDFKKYCNKIKEGEQFLKQYIAQKCVTGSSKTIISVYLYSSARANRKHCSSKANSKVRIDLLKMAGCVNPHKKLIKECMKSYINQLNLTHSIQNERQKIPYICCLSTQAKNCIHDTLANQNDPKCTEGALDDVVSTIDQHGGNTLNTFCDSTEDSDKCTTILKLPTSKPKPVSDPTPFRVLFKIFEKL